MPWQEADGTTFVDQAPSGWREVAEPAPRSWGDTALSAAQTADDFVRAAANAMTFGMADRFAGYMGGEGTEAEVKKSEAARERSPYASIGGDIAGAAALPGFGAEALAARYGSGLGARALGYGLTGAATGAAQGAGNTYTGDLPDYIRNAVIGGSLGGLFGAAGGAIFGARPQVSRAETPTVPELYADKAAKYDILAANPAQYDASHLAQRSDTLNHQLFSVDMFDPEVSRGTARALDRMRAPYEAAVADSPSTIGTISPAGIDLIRKGINRIPKGPDSAPDRESGRLVKQAIDSFVENPPLGAVMPGYEGAARVAAQQSVDARLANAAYKRAVTSDAMRQNAENLAASNYSGLNLENYLRQQYRTLLAVNKDTGISEAQRRGFSPAEINRFQQFVSGQDTPGRNLIRWGAKTAGGGSGLGALAAAGVGGGALASYTTDDPRWYGAIGLPLAGLALRSYGNRLALRNANQLDEMVRQRSPLFLERAAQTGMRTPGAPNAAQATRDAIALALAKPVQRLYVSPGNEE